jgi:transposase
MHNGGVKLVVDESVESMLREWLRARSTPQDLSQRARIILLGAEGVSIRETARRLSTTTATVKTWRARFRDEGIAGLVTRHRSGRKKTITPEKERSVVAATMRAPRNATPGAPSDCRARSV